MKLQKTFLPVALLIASAAYGMQQDDASTDSAAGAQLPRSERTVNLAAASLQRVPSKGNLGADAQAAPVAAAKPAEWNIIARLTGFAAFADWWNGKSAAAAPNTASPKPDTTEHHSSDSDKD